MSYIVYVLEVSRHLSYTPPLVALVTAQQVGREAMFLFIETKNLHLIFS